MKYNTRKKNKKNKNKKSLKSLKSLKNKTKKQFLFNPENPNKSFDVYIDKNPTDTINIKYTTLEDVKNTIDKLEKLYKNKKYTHKRIWQVGMIMYVRLKVLRSKKPKQYALANKYFTFLGKRTKLEEKARYKLSFEDDKNGV
jgi:hypothetical protein